MISNSFLSSCKRRGATLAGVFSLAFSCVLLFCGAGSVPIENLLPQGAMQGDLNAGGHNLTNAATVYATAVSATSVAVSGTLTAPSSFTLPFSKLTSTPATLSGYGITDPIVLTSGSYANPSWIASLAASKLTGALPAVSGASLTGLTFSQIGSTPTTLSGYGITDAEPALGNPSTNGYVLSSTTGGTRSWIAAGGSFTLDSSVTAVGFSYTSGTLYLANANAVGGLAYLVASDGTADGSIAFLGATDDGSYAIAIGSASAASSGAVSIGTNATGNGITIGRYSFSNSGGIVVGGYSTSNTGGVVIGSGSSATTGIAIGGGADETGGGAEFGFGSYAGAGAAINADEFAVPNASGYATLSGHDDSTTPTNSSTPVGWIHVHVNGTDSWIPYYQ